MGVANPIPHGVEQMTISNDRHSLTGAYVSSLSTPSLLNRNQAQPGHVSVHEDATNRCRRQSARAGSRSFLETYTSVQPTLSASNRTQGHPAIVGDEGFSIGDDYSRMTVDFNVPFNSHNSFLDTYQGESITGPSVTVKLESESLPTGRSKFEKEPLLRVYLVKEGVN